MSSVSESMYGFPFFNGKDVCLTLIIPELHYFKAVVGTQQTR